MYRLKLVVAKVGLCNSDFCARPSLIEPKASDAFGRPVSNKHVGAGGTLHEVSLVEVILQ